jgi:hypothetical protein
MGRPAAPSLQVIATLLITLTSLPIAADWITPPAREQLAASDVVVLGQLIGRDELLVDSPERTLTVAVVRVETVFKGRPDRAIVLLAVPQPRPNGLVSSADVVLTDGQRGLWFLTRGRFGLHQLDAPYRFLDFQFADEHLRALRADN